MGIVSLIVMEKGSEWPGHVGDCENLVAVGMGEDDDLVQMTRRRLDCLGRSGQQVHVAVLACSEATDAVSSALRAEVAHELLSVVAASASGRIVLTCAERVSMQSRRALLGLAASLGERLAGTSATVSMRFGAGAPAVRSCPHEPWPSEARTG